MAAVELTVGDLLNQDVDVVANAWNRNIIPWWLLLPQGISGAIKKRAGYDPFREVAKYGPIPRPPRFDLYKARVAKNLSM